MRRESPSRYFGSRNSSANTAGAATDTDADAIAHDIRARRTSIAQDAERRKVRWDKAMSLARSGEFPTASAIESVLVTLGLVDAQSSLSDQDLDQIQSVCVRAQL